MPVYAYGCCSCHATVERRQSFHDEPLRDCPSCGGVLRRRLSPVGVIFKGSGWYCTDSKSKSGSSESVSSDSAVACETSQCADSAPGATAGS